MRILMVNNKTFTSEDMGGFLHNNKIDGSVVCCVPGEFALDIAAKCDADMAVLYIDQSNIQAAADFLRDIKDASPRIYNMAMVQPAHFDCLGDELENLIDDYITVPIDSNELGLRMRKVMRLRQQTRASAASYETEEIREDKKDGEFKYREDEISSHKEPVQTESACSAAEADDIENYSCGLNEESDIRSESIDAGLHDLRATCKAGSAARRMSVNKNLILAVAALMAVLLAFLYSQGKLGGII